MMKLDYLRGQAYPKVPAKTSERATNPYRDWMSQRQAVLPAKQAQVQQMHDLQTPFMNRDVENAKEQQPL
jgi:hypothetical protein